MVSAIIIIRVSHHSLSYLGQDILRLKEKWSVFSSVSGSCDSGVSPLYHRVSAIPGSCGNTGVQVSCLLLSIHDRHTRLEYRDIGKIEPDSFDKNEVASKHNFSVVSERTSLASKAFILLKHWSSPVRIQCLQHTAYVNSVECLAVLTFQRNRKGFIVSSTTRWRAESVEECFMGDPGNILLT